MLCGFVCACVCLCLCGFTGLIVCLWAFDIGMSVWTWVCVRLFVCVCVWYDCGAYVCAVYGARVKLCSVWDVCVRVCVCVYAMCGSVCRVRCVGEMCPCVCYVCLCIACALRGKGYSFSVSLGLYRLENIQVRWRQSTQRYFPFASDCDTHNLFRRCFR